MADAHGDEVSAAAEALVRDVDDLPRPGTPAIRTLRRGRSKAWKGRPPAFIHAVALRLGERRRLRWVGYELIRFHAGAFASLDDRVLGGLAQGLDSWDSVDAFARILSGPAWAAGVATEPLIEAWARSDDRWLRRAALVSTVELNGPRDGGHGDAARTLAVCARLARDRDDMVEKALSWALRALAVRDPAAVRAFLAGHEAHLGARVKREVGAKLATGLKNPRQHKP